jgi:hypothetical protein
VVAAGRDHGDPAALALTATPQATALMPLAPVHVKAARDIGPPHAHRRRQLVGEVPLGEDSERYMVDIMSGATMLRTLSVTATMALYAAADELSDFGVPQAVLTVRVTQLSATVGRGFPADVILRV